MTCELQVQGWDIAAIVLNGYRQIIEDTLGENDIWDILGDLSYLMGRIKRTQKCCWFIYVFIMGDESFANFNERKGLIRGTHFNFLML